MSDSTIRAATTQKLEASSSISIFWDDFAKSSSPSMFSIQDSSVNKEFVKLTKDFQR